MTAVVPDVDLTLDVFYQELEKDALDIPCEADDPEIHADEFVSATMLWRTHCTDRAYCDSCHEALIGEVMRATGITAIDVVCHRPFVVSSLTIHPLGPIK